MLSLISTLGGLLISGLPKLLDFFQAKQDQKHEQELAKLANERDLAMAKEGFLAQQKIEEFRTEQVAMQTQAQMAEAEAGMVKGAQDHDKAILEKSSTWVANYIGTVRPTVTYLFIFELIGINTWIAWYGWTHPGMMQTMDDFIRFTDIIFTPDEMSMLGGIIGFWFGSRNWQKK
jgi:ElaB/YqjD/DUF883 family membrane-anchored ribosome-binding protein